MNPRPLVSLRQCLQKAKQKAFQTHDLKRPQDLKAWFFLQELGALLETESQISKSLVEVEELAFDRLLLNTSVCYLRTRRLGRSLGIKFKPRILSTRHSLSAFDASGNTLYYPPVATELRWLATSRGLEQYRIQRFDQWRHFITSAYHDLNHMIFFHGLKSLNDCQGLHGCATYFALVESLVALRDFEIAGELGDVAVPLAACGILLRAAKDIDLADNDRPPLSFEIFSGLFVYTFLEVAGFSAKERAAVFRCLKRRVPRHPSLGTGMGFVTETSPAWVGDFVAKSGGKLKLPACPATFPARELKIKLSSPEDMVRDEILIGGLYAWYLNLFWPGHTPSSG